MYNGTFMTTNTGTFQTKLGKLGFTANRIDGVTVRTEQDGLPIVVRKVPYRVSVYLRPIDKLEKHYDIRGKTWGIQYDTIYIRRSDRWKDDYPSPSAKKTICETIIEEWEKIVREDVLVAGEVAYQEHELESAMAKCKELQEELARKQEECGQIAATLAVYRDRLDKLEGEKF